MARIGANNSFARRIDTVGWALFFMWVGIALLAGVGWTWSLIGTAIIILGVQAVFLFRGERIDAFMAAVGIALLGGAVADIYGSSWSLIPAFLIVIGLAMLAETVRPGRPRAGTRG